MLCCGSSERKIGGLLAVFAGAAVAIGTVNWVSAREPEKAAAPASAPATKSEPAKAIEEAPKAANPAKELLAKAKKAGMEAKDVSMTMEVAPKGEGAPPSGKAKVVATFKKGAGFPLGNWRIEPEASKGKIVAFDGTMIRTIDPEKKEMVELQAPGGLGFPTGDEMLFMPTWFMEQRQDMMAMLNPREIELVIEGEPGKSMVGNEAVTVLKQVREIKPPAMDEGEGSMTLRITNRWHLGADNLPRKIETAYEQIKERKGEGDKGENDKQEIVYIFGDLKVNTSPANDVFALKAPEGYKTTKAESESEDDGKLKVSVGEKALDFNLKDPEGKEYTLASFNGKVTLLDFWATWCGPCKAAMPSIQKLHEEFAGKAVAIVGVNTWERKADAGPKYMAEKKYTYQQLMKGDDLAKSYGITGIPTMILIDKDGKVLHTVTGFGPGEEDTLRAKITEALGK